MDQICSSLNIDEKEVIERVDLKIWQGFLKLLRISNHISAVHEKVYPGRSNPPWALNILIYFMSDHSLPRPFFRALFARREKLTSPLRKQSGLSPPTLKVVDSPSSVFPLFNAAGWCVGIHNEPFVPLLWDLGGRGELTQTYKALATGYARSSKALCFWPWSLMSCVTIYETVTGYLVSV